MLARAANPVRDSIESAVRRLSHAGVETARLDAELLMAHACGATRAEVLAGRDAPSPQAAAQFEQFVARRAAREPLAYIVGRREFYALDLIVTPAVLIPRPETETVVDAALAFIADAPGARVLDLGTGSGCIAIAIAANAPRARIVATDVSAAALEVARANAMRLHLTARVDFVCGDLFEAVNGARFDLVVSNPPYVEDGATLAPEISDFEPPLALYAGPDGLAFYRRIAASIRDHLEPGGMLIVEVGATQADAVAALCREAGAINVEATRDLAGAQRIVQARFA
ncbi:MAG TPA: peptide chain release factor N(5)-glutamine methyltransferase [Candidatus Binataceae bacterium]|nr:peptide chain release factor N(5)-glutamine methyltransferase [Candidatus Binataceae bacterium]